MHLSSFGKNAFYCTLVFIIISNPFSNILCELDYRCICETWSDNMLTLLTGAHRVVTAVHRVVTDMVTEAITHLFTGVHRATNYVYRLVPHIHRFSILVTALFIEKIGPFDTRVLRSYIFAKERKYLLMPPTQICLPRRSSLFLSSLSILINYIIR